MKAILLHIGFYSRALRYSFAHQAPFSDKAYGWANLPLRSRLAGEACATMKGADEAKNEEQK